MRTSDRPVLGDSVAGQPGPGYGLSSLASRVRISVQPSRPAGQSALPLSVRRVRQSLVLQLADRMQRFPSRIGGLFRIVRLSGIRS